MLTILLVTVLAVIIVGSYVVWVTVTSLRNKTEQEEIVKLDAYARNISNFLTGLEQDVTLLSHSQSLAEYLSARDAGLDDELTARALAAVEQDFFAFAQARGVYDQIRFLTADGQETIRINTNASGVSTIVPPEKLQNKADRYYFADTIVLPPGDVFISPLDLNIEQGKIEILPDGSNKPVIRYGTPVVYQGQVVGVIVTNVLARNFLDLLRPGGNIILTDQDGYYLYHPDEAKRWGRDLDTGITLFSDYSPEIGQAMLSKEAGAFADVDTFFAHYPISLPGHPEITWYLGEALSQKLVFAPIYKFIYGAIAVTALALLIAAGAAILLSRAITTPIVKLENAALQAAAGDLTVQARVESEDEIGRLAAAFNTMTARQRENIASLEKYTRQIETVVDVSHRLTAILGLSDLMHQVVNLIKETFGYYHVHIYLLEGETLLMAEGYGQAGVEMKRQEHSIPLAAPRSLVARAAREGRIITVENVRDDPDWLPNPLLPDTHSEMAVPVLLGYEIVGVLDVQSEKAGDLSAADEDVLRPLADQVAIAVRNARAFAQSQEALHEAQKLQQLYTGEAWEKFGASRTTTDYEVRQPDLSPLEEISTPEATAALQQLRTVALSAGSSDNEGAAESKSGDGGERPPEVDKALATPLKLGDQIIGVLGIRDENPERHWTEDEIALIEAVSEQMSLAIENARLFEDTQRSAWRDRTVSETTARIWSSDEVADVMKAAVAQLGEKLEASEVVIQLGTVAAYGAGDMVIEDNASPLPSSHLVHPMKPEGLIGEEG